MIAAIFGRIGGWLLAALGVFAFIKFRERAAAKDATDAIAAQQQIADATAVQERSKVDEIAAAAGRSGNVDWLRANARKK